MPLGRRSQYNETLEKLSRHHDTEQIIRALESSKRHDIHAALTTLRSFQPAEDDRAPLARAIIMVRAPLTLELELERIDIASRYCDAIDDQLRLPERPLVDDALLRAKWSSLKLTIDPSAVASTPRDNALDEAVAQLGIAHIHANNALIFALVQCEGQKSLYAEHGLALIELAVNDGSLDVEQAARALMLGLEHDTPDVRATSLGIMTRRAWARYASPDIPTATLCEMCRSESAALRRAAVGLLGEAEQTDTLELLLKNPNAPQDVRRLAMQHLAHAADQRTLDDILQIASSSPELFATEALIALTSLHHCGVFINPEQIEELLLLHVHARQSTAKNICALMYTCRHELLDVLRQLGPKHPHWRRHLALLVHLEGGGVLLEELIRAWSDTQNIERLRAALRVARRLADPALEEAIWLAAPHCFGECITALETCATEHTRDRLERMLCVHEPQHTPNLSDRAHEQASFLLWALASESYREQILAPRFDPIRSELALLDRFFPRTPGHRHRASATRCAHEGHIARLLEVICTREDSDDEPLIRELFTRWLARSKDYTSSEHRPAPWNQEEALIPQDIMNALESFGAHLYSAGRPVLRELATLKSPRRAGQFYANHVLLESIDVLPELRRESATPMLLAALRTPLHRLHLRRVKPLIRSKSPRVRREVIRVTAASNDPGMLTWFRALVKADDIESIRQALDALGQYTGGKAETWSARAVAECLEHRNMNIKINAARTLARVGTTRTIDRLLFWLGHHDNSSFRAALSDALVSIAGSRASARAIISAKTIREHEPRRLMLLERAITDLSRPRDASIIDPPTLQSPRWLDDILDADPTDRASAIDTITTRRISNELIAPHVDTLLRWCDDEALQARRGALLRWLTSHLATPHEDVRIERIERIRALATLPVQADLTRLTALRACGAKLGARDHAALIEDARRSRSPEALTNKVIQLATEQLTPYQGDMDALTRDKTSSSRRELKNVVRTLKANATTLSDDVIDQWLPRLVCLRPLLTSREIYLRSGITTIEPTASLLDKLRAHDPHERSNAASALASRYIGPELELELFSMYLNGKLSSDVRPDAIARALDWIDPEDLAAISGELDRDETKRLLELLDETMISGRTLPVLLRLWRNHDEELRAHAQRIIRRLPAATVLTECIDQIEAGELEYCSLLTGKLVDGALAKRLKQKVGERNIERFDTLTITPPVFAHAPISTPDLLELLDQHDPPQLQRTQVDRDVNEPDDFEQALTALRSDQDAEVLTGLRFLRRFRDEAIAERIFELLEHDNPKVRSTAARTLRYVGSKELSYRGSIVMLGDARRDVRISALDSLGHARYVPAIPHIIEHMIAKDQRERERARAALTLIGEPAIPTLIYTRGRARPDQRNIYDTLIETIEGSSQQNSI